VPFLAEGELKRLDGLYEKSVHWKSFAIILGGASTMPDG
jgi:hypothetical protein